MPRKSVGPALRDYLQADYNRWRLLARSREFRKDVAKYLTEYEKLKSWVNRHEPLWGSKSLNKLDTLHYRYLGRWRVRRLPDLALWPDSERLLTIEGLERRLLTIEGLERWYQAARNAKSDFAISAPPVSILGSRPGGGFQYIIEISVDRSLALDQLIPLIHKELRHSYFGGHARGKPLRLDFQLRVFDLMNKPINGKEPTCADVARILKRRPSSVQSAFRSICRKMESLDIRSEFLNSIARPILENPKLKHLLDPDNLPAAVEDISNCPDCREAPTTEELCPKHKALIPKDKTAWRERPGLDLSAVEHARARRALGQKEFWSDPSSDE